MKISSVQSTLSAALLKSQQASPVPSSRTTTPRQFEIDIFQKNAGDKKATVQVNAEKAQFSPVLTSRYVYCLPGTQPQNGQQRLYWTKNYIGTDRRFYRAGYRWGISLGGSAKEFKRSILYLPDGGINLPNGKYMIAIRTNAKGKMEVILGKEERGIHQRVLDMFNQGVEPDSNAKQEILGVTNHAMLISRGRPYDPNAAGDFAALFAGEVEIINHRINALNDQTGQLFGPNGLLKPPHEATLPDDLAMAHPDFMADKTIALYQARQILEKLTHHRDIRLIQVTFEDEAPSRDILTAPGQIRVKPEQARMLQAMLTEPRIQNLFDAFQADPPSRLRVLKGLAQNGDQRHAIFDLLDKRYAAGMLKPEQGAQLALDLLETPEAIGIFLPDSPLYLSFLSDNSKRKILATYNRDVQPKGTGFAQFIRQLKRQHHLMHFLAGRRIPGSFMRLSAEDLKDADRGVRYVQNVFRAASADAEERPRTPELRTEPVIIRNVSVAQHHLKHLQQQVRKHPGRKLTVLLEANPFNGVGLLKGDLPRNLQTLRHLANQGVTLYRDSATQEARALNYLINMYAFAHEPASSEEVLIRREITALLTQYQVDVADLHRFTRERFSKRWSNDQVISAYAKQSKAFRRFLKDLSWFISLPKVHYPVAG